MTPDVYPAMRDAGCVGFNMGLESGSDRILAKTKIGCTVKNFEKLYKEAKKNRLFVDVSYMVANENETVEDMRATFNLGIGLIAVVDKSMVERVLKKAAHLGEPGIEIGRIKKIQ